MIRLQRSATIPTQSEKTDLFVSLPVTPDPARKTGMRRHITTAMLYTVATTVLFGLVYPLVVTGVAQLLFHDKANGQLIYKDGSVVGSRIIGQSFTGPTYFHSRPSAAGSGYDAANSSGSNYAPTNKKLIDRVAADASILQTDSSNAEIPIDLVTASGSGLDPHITPAGAEFGDQSRELALWLGSQASIALENVRLHRLVARQASTDGLTELANRREFEDSLANEISRAERFGGTLALILADLDNFKQVNDRFGHQAGDEVLRSFADILRETVRDIDVAARYGGEEFAILLPQTDIAGAEALAERLREAVESRAMAEAHDDPVTVTSSFGVASFPEAGTGPGLFAAADEALYRAKRAGKNCVVCAEANGPVRAPH